MRLLILGGTALTGPHVVRRLVDLGHEVTVFHRGCTQAELPPSVREVLGDKDRLLEYAGELRRIAPEVVVNMVALTREDATTFKEAFRGVSRRVVVISSADVYRAYGRLHRSEPGPPDPVPLTEDSPLREKLSVDGPGYDKTGVEQVVMSDPDLPATVLRYPAVYGPGDKQHRLFRFVRPMEDGRAFILLEEAVAQWRFTHGYAENVAVATVLAATEERATGRVYNVGEPETPPWAEWVRRIGRAAGWTGDVVAVPSGRMPEAMRSPLDFRQHWVVDTSRIRQELGYAEVVPVDEALRRTVAWERANPPATVPPEWFDYAAEDAVMAQWARGR